MLEFRILGALEVREQGRALSLGAPKQRALLAALLLHRREVVSTDRLIDELWGERPPGAATKTVQVYVSRLRKVLGDGVLITRGGGYVLDIGPDQVDADRFERLAEGREILEGGDARAAAETLRSALQLWRGEPLTDFTFEEFARNETGRLEELRLAAFEDRIEADLALGRHGTLVPELERLVAEHPDRERMRGQLMLALYRSGRQAEALERYRDARRALDRDLRLEPGPELQELERAILTQDPAIAAPARSRGPELIRTGRGGTADPGGRGTAAGGSDRGRDRDRKRGRSRERAGGRRLGGRDRSRVESGDHDRAHRRATHGRLGGSRLDLGRQHRRRQCHPDRPGDEDRSQHDSARIQRRRSRGGTGAVWIAASRGSELVRLDPVLRAERSVRLAGSPDPFPTALPSSPVAASEEAVWAIKPLREIARIDPDRDRVVAQVAVGNNPTAIATGARAVWVADADDNNVIQIDPGTANAVTKTTPVGREPSAIAAGEGAVWVANTQDGTVARIAPSSASVTDTISVGGRPTGIAAGDGAIWVANSLDGTVSRIDPESNEVIATVDVGEAPQGLTFSHGLVWVSVPAVPEAPAPPADLANDDVARSYLEDDLSSTDPALALGGDIQISYATCALLYNYPDRPFPVGARLRPEVAAGQPIIADGGRKYIFKIRSGFRFSPPSNEPVTAAAFQRAIERALDPRMHAYGAQLVREIAGAKAYRAGQTHQLSGVSAHGDELVIRLTKPVPNLPARLSAQSFCAVPPDTPAEPGGVDELPSAGPYYVASHEPGESLVLRRNPNYDGPRPHALAEIQFEIGTPTRRAVAEIEAGHADYVELRPELEGAFTPKAARVLEERYGPRSEAARAGRQQFFTQPAPFIASFVFNTRRGPFTDARLRRAVNYGIDRRALAVDAGLDEPGRPTDQYIPPGFPGFEDVPIYPLGGPDVATARRLAGDLKRDAVLYTCDSLGCARNAEILRSNLRAIGIQLEIRQFPLPEMFGREYRRDEPWDIALYGWLADYGDPYNFINTQFTAEADAHRYHPGGFYDPRFERRMKEAALLKGDARLRAYAKLDRDLTTQAAPQATFASGESSSFLSARMGCEVPHPVYGLDLAALCIRDETQQPVPAAH